MSLYLKTAFENWPDIAFLDRSFQMFHCAKISKKTFFDEKLCHHKRYLEY